MLTVENSSPLIGGTMFNSQEKQQRIRITRARVIDKEIVGKGSVLDVPLSFAVEMRTARAAEFVQADTPLQRNSNPTVPASLALETEPKGKKAA